LDRRQQRRKPWPGFDGGLDVLSAVLLFDPDRHSLNLRASKPRKEFYMDIIVELVDVWAASIEDKPGALASVLASLRDAGADLQSIIARRAPERQGSGVVFVTPLQGDKEIRVASEVGFNVTHKLHSVRVMGRDRPGIAAEVAQCVADAGINLRGFSASAIGTQFAAYFAVDSLDDANRVMDALKRA
jgi:hypothetical protein